MISTVTYEFEHLMAGIDTLDSDLTHSLEVDGVFLHQTAYVKPRPRDFGSSSSAMEPKKSL